MKKIALFVSVLLLAGSLFAQDDASAKVDALAKKVPALGGSVTFTFGSDDLVKNPLTFSGAKTGTVGDLTVGIDNDQVSAGVTIGTTPVIAKVDGTSALTTTKDNYNARDYLIKALDWYTAKKGKTDWDKTHDAIQWRNVDAWFDTLLAAQNNAIATNHATKVSDLIKVTGTAVAAGDYGTAVAGKQSYSTHSWTWTIGNPKTQDAAVNDWLNAKFNALWTAIKADIATMVSAEVLGTTGALPPASAAAISTKFSIGIKDVGTNATGAVATLYTVYGDNGTTGPYYFVINDGAAEAYEVTEALGDQIKNVVAALKSANDSILGAATDPTWAASWKISNAFFKIKKVFGVVDMGFVVEGKAVSVGSMVTSKLTSADKGSQVGLTLGLSKGVVEGLSADILFNLTSGTKAADLATYYDLVSKTTAKEEPIAGLQVDLGYATDMFGVKLAAGLGDVLGTKDKNSLMLSVQPSLTLKDVAGLNVGAEFTLARGAAPGFGIGAKVGLNVMGIAPTVTYKMKDANFKGDDSSNLNGTDKIDATSLSGEFNSTDNAAMSLDAALAVDLKEVIGMKLVTLNGGFGIMLQNAANSKNNYGFSGGVGLDLNEVLSMPLTFNWSISQYAAEDMVNSFKLAYAYGTASLAAEFKIKGTTNSLNFTAGVKF